MSIPGAHHDFVFVETDEALETFAGEWLPAVDGGQVALDIEEAREYTYWPRVALVQLTIDGHDAVLDPLRITKPAFSAFIEALCLTAGEVVAHGSNNDVSGLKRDFGVGPARLRDTQVAARFAGLTQFGLAALLQAEFGVELDKSLRRSDWSLRPLTRALLEYARADTRHLLGLWDVLAARAEGRGWLDAVIEECDALAALPAERVVFDPTGWSRMRGVNELDELAQDRASALWAWRDRVGAAHDLHPSRVLPPWALILHARRGPKLRPEEFPTGVHAKATPAERAEFRDMLDAPPPAARANGARVRDTQRNWSAAELQARIDRLLRWRDRAAAATGIESGFLAPRGVLEAVARSRAEDVDALRELPEARRWRVDRYGGEWLEALKA